MAYVPYFKDRVVQYPGRLKLTDVDTGVEMTVDVERAEGNITAAGTLINADNLDYGTTLGYVQLDTSAAAGTTDGDLYRALQALGWDGDCIEE